MSSLGGANPGAGQCAQNNRRRIQRIALRPVCLRGGQKLTEGLAEAAIAARIAGGGGTAIRISRGRMGMMMVMMAPYRVAASCLSQILDVRKLAARGGALEVG